MKQKHLLQVIDAMIGLDDTVAPDWLAYAVSWANQKRAPVLSIDPCLLSNAAGVRIFFSFVF